MNAMRWMDWFGVDPSISGDIVERAARHSRFWICRQVLAAIVLTTVRDLRSRPRQALAAMLVGWGSVLLFFTFGDRIANAPGKIIWNWTVEHGYDGLRTWWFHGAQYVPVSYLGFALSGWIVSRFGRPAWLLAYATSVFGVVTGTEAILECLNRPMVIPYKFIAYVLSPSGPPMWRSGLVLIPMAVWLGGVSLNRDGERQRTAARSGD
jgi:hypothetical protein